MDSTFLAAWFSRPPVILGRQLLPLSCGHCAILDGMAFPYLAGSEAITRADLVRGVWVCSRDFETSRKEVHEDARRDKEAQEWGESAEPGNFLADAAAFSAYFATYTKAPARWRKEGAKRAKAPWYLVIATTLMRELSWSERRAWNAPIPEALWYFAAIAEQNGDDSLISEDEQARLGAIREAVKAGAA